MRFLRTLGLTMLSLVVILSLVALGIASNVNSTLLHPDTYLNAFEKAGLYGGLTGALTAFAKAQEIPPEYKTVLVESVLEAVPDDWVKERSSALVRFMFSYLKGSGEEGSAISLLDAKSRLRDALLKRVPSKQEVEEFLAAIPDHLDLRQVLDVPQLGPIRLGVKIARAVPWIALGTVAFCLLVGIALAGARVALRWLGGAALVSGVLLYVLDPISARFVQDLAADMVTEMPPQLAQAAHSALKEIASSLGAYTKAAAYWIWGGGIASLAAGFIPFRR